MALADGEIVKPCIVGGHVHDADEIFFCDFFYLWDERFKLCILLRKSAATIAEEGVVANGVGALVEKNNIV